MKKKQMIALAVAAAIFIVTGIMSVLTNTLSQNLWESELESILSGDFVFQPPLNDHIAVVEVAGTIEQQTEEGLFDDAQSYKHQTTMEYIDALIQDSSNKAMLLYVDSPGGTVYESEELYLKLQEYKEKTGRPIWGYMSHYAASGGYMISMACDKIYANANTTTGSIGVILSGYDMTGLYEKLGIRYVSITSGANKDSSRLTEEQIAIYQSQIDEYYEKFVGIVAEGRQMPADTVKALADGRTYTAKQALDNGLIDQISLFEEMKEEMQEEMGTDVLYQLESPDSVLSSVFSRIESLIPKSEAQVLTETADRMESGVPMYYAEQLR